MTQPVNTSSQKNPDMSTQTLRPGDLVTLREIDGLRPIDLDHPLDCCGFVNYIDTTRPFNVVNVREDTVELGGDFYWSSQVKCHIAHCVLVSKYEDRPKAWITEKHGKFRIHKLSEEAPSFNHITAEISCDESPEMLQEVLSRIVNSQSSI